MELITRNTKDFNGIYIVVCDSNPSLGLFVSMENSGAIAIIYAILASVLVMFVNAYVVEKRIEKYEI
jgi:hypothetical protein